MKTLLKNLALGAILLTLPTLSGCQVWNAIPSSWKLAGANAACDWIVDFFSPEE